MKTLYYGAGILFALSMAFVLLALAITGVGLSLRHHRREFIKLNTAESLKMDLPEVMYVSGEIVEYLKGRRENLVVEAVVDGKPREFFSHREKLHMEDVLDLFLAGYKIQNISAGLMLITGVWLIYKRRTFILARCAGAVSAGILTVLLLLAILIASDFSNSFILFHHIFFTNDLWLLDPKTDLLIRMVPEQFFMNTAFYIFIWYLMLLTAVLSVSILVLKKTGQAQ